jgi:hypothetical protein
MPAYNRLVGGSSPLSPTTHSHANRDFLKYRKMPAFGVPVCEVLQFFAALPPCVVGIAEGAARSA